MTARRVVVWRHGRTSWNATGRYQGQADIPLDGLGRRQAAAAAGVIKELKPSAIFSSDLSRATQTARALADVTGLEISLDPRLREINVGSWEGLTVEEAAEADPELVAAVAAGEDVRRSPSGETTSEVADRASAAITDIIGTAEDESTVVITMHGTAGRVGIGRFLGVDWDRLGSLRNCAWVILDRHTLGHWYIGAYNLHADFVVPDDERVA
ncbi:histidine phosphatase family protein [Microlunatus sp. Gsoil 973]|jgi:probable phosphoglycerate mutase|uniref:histidine phosphatase family protein n=1 Tax=Microlunatus sp. Gsoil 973 TaxID=2672569 RepID=UPI0012B4FD1A|nr:histidine phosphatase family protein [Microlunatus sp. Gsoil 973]QGN31691.1 histidine phosphatase family protein [Microlunatus sp. Gsoil 973]